MGKRKHFADPAQFGFVFEAPRVATVAGELACLESMICGAVSEILHRDERSRGTIAAAMSELLDDPVSKQMLDAYASAAREGHKVPMSRFLALVAVTDRQDILDRILRRVGAAVLVGEEVHTAQLGHLDRQIADLQAQRKRVAAQAPMIRGNRES